MCRHATGDIATVPGTRIEYFCLKRGVKVLKVADFPPHPLLSICLVQVDLTKLILNHLLAVFDICHPLTAPSSFLHCLSLYLSFPNSSGKWNHKNISPETQSILFLTSSKQNRGYWSLSERLLEILSVCVYVDQLRNHRRGRRECSLQPLQPVWQSASEVWLPKAMSHSFISIILRFSLKPCCSSPGSTISPSLCSLQWPPAWFFLLPQGVPVCVINKIVSANLQALVSAPHSFFSTLSSSMRCSSRNRNGSPSLQAYKRVMMN